MTWLNDMRYGYIPSEWPTIGITLGTIEYKIETIPYDSLKVEIPEEESPFDFHPGEI